MIMVAYSTFDTPIGEMRIASTEAGVCHLALPNEDLKEFLHWLQKHVSQAKLVESKEMNDGPVRELLAYLNGDLKVFKTFLDMRGTDFQRAVWRAVALIPYGETRSYADIAREIGRPNAFRAVGAANGANPLPLFIPCHRVVGSNGSLTGYGGGMSLKERLLKLEKQG